MRWQALLLTAVLSVGLFAAVAYVVAGDLVRELLDAADPIAAFTDELQDEVDAALDRVEWLRDCPDFARWEQEMSS